MLRKGEDETLPARVYEYTYMLQQKLEKERNSNVEKDENANEDVDVNANADRNQIKMILEKKNDQFTRDILELLVNFGGMNG